MKELMVKGIVREIEYKEYTIRIKSRSNGFYFEARTKEGYLRLESSNNCEWSDFQDML